MDNITQKKASALLAHIKFTTKASIEKTGLLMPTATFFRHDGKVVNMELEDTMISQQILLLSMAFDAIAVAIVWEEDDTVHITMDWRDEESQKVRRLCSERSIHRGLDRIMVGKERLKWKIVTAQEANVRGSRPSQHEIDGVREIIMAQTPLHG